jgi:hypothetical protein
VDINVACVPSFDGLNVVDFIHFARDHPQCLEFLPDEQDLLHLDKHWICDVLFTLEKEAFQHLINSAMA